MNTKKLQSINNTKYKSLLLFAVSFKHCKLLFVIDLNDVSEKLTFFFLVVQLQRKCQCWASHDFCKQNACTHIVHARITH